MGYRNWGNQIFSFVNKSPSTLHYNSKSDWVLLVEGETDCIFYSRFTQMAVFSIDIPQKAADTDFPDKKINLCKLQILHLVNTKLSHPKQKHWYGIIDKDYDSLDLKDFINSKLKNKGTIYNEIYKNIQNTTAHSLETMLIEIMSVGNFENFINQTFNLSPQEKYPFSIVEKALLFAFDIGCLRKWKTNLDISGNKEKINQYFKTVENKSKNYLNFLYFKTLDSETKDICFNFKYNPTSYTFNLAKFSTSIKKVDIEKDNYHKNLKKHKYQFNNDKWTICHGHDTFSFIESIIKLCYSKKFAMNQFENDILMNYPISIFQQSPIGKWLLKLNNQYSQNKQKKKVFIVKKKTK